MVDENAAVHLETLIIRRHSYIRKFHVSSRFVCIRINYMYHPLTSFCYLFERRKDSLKDNIDKIGLSIANAKKNAH